VYQEAFEWELAQRDIPFVAQCPLHIDYKSHRLHKTYVADFVCFEKMIVEIKALKALTSVEQSQLLNYMKVTGLQVGLLINFGSHGQLEWQRLVL
jgi:GxxExxY protein